MFFSSAVLSLSTVVLSIGLMQVSQHYTHTFEKLMFNFLFQSDPTLTGLYGDMEQND